MKKLFENWRRFINESAPYGSTTIVPGLAGSQGMSAGTEIQPHVEDEFSTEEREDSDKIVKAVLQRNGHVLLLYNREKGWDLPGGHLKQGEGESEGLAREVGEETQISIDLQSLEKLPTEADYENTLFWGGEYLKDSVVLSGEHHAHAFKTVEEIESMPDGGSKGLPSHYKNAIRIYFDHTQEPQG
jgi:8-oxo-dGTP pyrophosphatase MutT (NUDIX family)